MKFFTAIALLGAALAKDEAQCDTANNAVLKGATATAIDTTPDKKFKPEDCKSFCDAKADADKNYYCCNYVGDTNKKGEDPYDSTCVLFTAKKDGNDNKYENAMTDTPSTETFYFKAWANDGSDDCHQGRCYPLHRRCRRPLHVSSGNLQSEEIFSI